MKSKIKLYQPTIQQLEIHQSTARFRSLACGRRWGKNYVAHNDMAANSWKYSNTITFWTAPVYRQAKRDYRRFKDWFSGTIKQKWDSELRFELVNGSIIEFHGLEEPENIEGEGLDFLYVDEAGMVKDNAWYNSLMPMLSDKQGRALLFGKPKGKGNWFYKFWQLGQSDKSGLYFSKRYRSSENPYIPAQEFEDMKKVLPALVYAQEYDAEFLDAGSGVFAGYQNCIIDELLDKPDPGRYYRIGIDLAKHQDWTVLTIIDIKTKQVVGFKRFNDLDWSIQKRIIVDTAKYWNDAEIIIDSTGVGDAIYDDLKRMGVHITPYKFTNSSKIALIENLIVCIQNQSIGFPPIEQLMTELSDYEYKRTPSGNIQYNAPQGTGKHDDCVISLALAVMFDSPVIDLSNLKYPENNLKNDFDSIF